MKDFFIRLLAGILIAITRMLPDPDADKATKSSVFDRLKRKPQLDYPISKAHLSRIFRLGTGPYTDVNDEEAGLKIRTAAGYPAPALIEYEHGFGDTQRLHAEKSATVHVNVRKYGRLSTWDGVTTTIVNTIKSIPKILMYSRNLSGFLSQAIRLDPAPHPCEQAIVASTPDNTKTLFTLRATFLDGDKDEQILLRDIFMPVVNEQGALTGLKRVDPAAPDAGVQALRSLIFMKLVMDTMRDQQPVNARDLLNAASALPLTPQSTLKEYLTYRP